MTRLAYELTEKKLSAEQFAAQLRESGTEISGQTIRILRDNPKAIYRASHEKITAIANALGITPEELTAPFDIIVKQP